nr:Chain C, truncated hemagglutinin peptide [synthetic construct]4I5B_F Chain F, truncated hemagglutinin peptide [synthetic construct]
VVKQNCLKLATK